MNQNRHYIYICKEHEKFYSFYSHIIQIDQATVKNKYVSMQNDDSNEEKDNCL